MSRSLHVLFVEDNPADAELARETLGHGEAHVDLSFVTDGREAIDFLYRRGRHAGARRPDLVFLDLNMPRLDGRAVLAQIKSDPELRRIPVVVLTSSTAESDVERSYDLGANCVVTKPVDLHQFERVADAIERFWFSVARLTRR